MKQIRIGLIGAGMISNKHLQCFQDIRLQPYPGIRGAVRRKMEHPQRLY